MQDKQKPLMASFYAALGDLQNPVKDTDGYGYKYAMLDQVIGIIRPALRAHGCDFTQRRKRAGDGFVLITYILNEDEMMEVDERAVIDTNDPQKSGSWETYMRRYALICVFGLAAEDDDGRRAKPPKFNDANHATVVLKNVLVAHFSGDVQKASDEFSRIMEPDGAENSLPYITQQIEKYS